MAISLKFLICLVTVAHCYGSKNCGQEFTKRVNYYENLINREINKSLNYQLPDSAAEYKPDSERTRVYGSYDFIIVGAGPTGSVIANRLTEVNKWKVLVLEAGEFPTEFAEIPGLYLFLENSQFNWNYKTVRRPQSCLGFVNEQCSVSRGKIIGGSSGINGLVYSRGNKEDFRRWASQGNKGWSYEDILPYYVKSENCQADGDPGYHGKGGYWNVNRIPASDLQYISVIRAHEQAFNCTINNDFNGKQQLGFSNLQFNIIRNEKHSAGDAFLDTVIKRKNLEVLEKAFVTKLIINNKRTRGVEFTHKGKIYFARAKKEVILSAGAISTPKILILSGIGPKAELEKHNISIVKELPVGETIYEPAGYVGMFIQTNVTVPVKTVRQNVEDYLRYTGLYQNPGNANGIGLYQSSYTTIEDYPDIELKYIGIPSGDPTGVRELYAISNETFNALWPKLEPQSTFNIFLKLLHPKSRGTLKLPSSDPYEYPLIDLNILGDPQDVEVLYEAVQIIEKLLSTPAMKAINASIVYGDFDRCKNYEKGSKDYWKCAFQLLVGTSYASSSTCRMGPDQSTAVVNEKLEVYGIRNLRVADVSIFPDPVSGSPTATAVLIGEKISDTIKINYGEKIETITNYLN